MPVIRYYCSRMNLIQKIRSAFSTKAATVVSLTTQPTDPGFYSLLGAGFNFGTNSRDFLITAYGLNPYVFMVIDRICQRLIQIDKLVLDRTGQEITDQFFLELLDKPNQKENGNTFLYRAAATYLAAGECFVVRQISADEPDSFFVPINYNVVINENTKGDILSYGITRFNHSETYLPSDVLHIKKPDITRDENHGFSTLRPLRKVWESNNEVWGSEAALHKNKGIAGVLYSDGDRPMTPTEQADLQAKYERDFTGQDNFGKVKVSSSKLGYIQMGMNPNDLKSIETRLEHLRTVCAGFNVDSKLFGDSAASTYNNMAEAQVAFIINAVIPLSKVLLPKIVLFMSSRTVFKSYTMELDEDSIQEMQLKKEQRSARIGREVIQGILNPAQARAILYPELTEAEQEKPLATPEVRPNINASDIISLQTAIAGQTITRDQAIMILIQIYGLDEQAANALIG